MCHVVKVLLEHQSFELTLKAKIRFPAVFDVSPTQSADQEASEAKAARDEADAVRKITENAVGSSDCIKPHAKIPDSD